MTRALLVGCDTYPALQQALGKRYEDELALRGPGNDARLVRDTLADVLGLTKENTLLLAGWEQDPKSRPTRANILAGLEHLAAASRSGDLVVVYLAGHGSQQRVNRIKPEEEPDGLEEIFLSSDVRPAEGEQGHVPNSIRDDELGERLGAIRASGAEVWLIVDACHSGTLLRSAGGDVRLRGVDPELLGAVPRTRGGPERSRARAPAGGWLDVESAGIAALYGATSYGRAPEMLLPRGAADARPHGLFTYLLCQELRRVGAGATYRELSERVISAYQAFPCAITVPTAEGDLDRAIAGAGAGRSADALTCVLTSGVPSLNQGRLAGLEPGVIVQLFELEAGAERSVARLEVTEADLVRARGRLLEGELVPERGPWRARAEARPLGDYRLVLALVRPDGSAAPVDELPERLRSELAGQRENFPLEADPTRADWWLVLAGGGRLWLRPGPREGGFDLCDVRPEELLGRLRIIQNARNLRRFAGSPFAGEWQGDLVVSVERQQGRDWRALERDAVLRPGERIRVGITKTSEAIYDVNVFYLDANCGLTVLAAPSGTPRMDASTRARPVYEATVIDNALGLENLLVFATPRTEASRVVDLGALAQRGLTRGAGDGADPFEELVAQVLQGRELRSAARPAAGAAATGSLLRSLCTEWGELGPPPWPGQNAALARPQRAGGAGAGQDLARQAAVAPPDPWEVGARAALARSRRKLAGYDLLLLGDREVEAVLVDFDQGVAATSDLSALVGARAFEAEAAFLFGPTRLACYDRDDDGVLDLVLEDAEADGVAEARWALESGAWRREAPVALPWLSQAYVPLRGRKDTDVSTCLQALQRGP